MKKYTAIILGGGPAGHSAAVRLAQLGGKVALVERDFIGGICTNWGCTPSKSMIESAKVAQIVAQSGKYGVQTQETRVDFEAIAQRRDHVILQTRASITDLLQHHQVDIFQGEGEIIAPGKMRVRAGKLDADGKAMHYDGGEFDLQAEHIIIATGSQPLRPAFIDPNDASVVSSNRLISIKELPRQLTIIGGGVIGLEFATIFSSLGSQVTIVEFLERVLAQMDEEISSEITRILEERGVRILTAHKCVSLKKGLLEAEDIHSGALKKLEAPMTLVAIGRQAVLHNESYRRLGLKFSQKGVEVDECQRSNLPGIWAVGDATGKSILAHVGIQQGIIAAENIMAPASAVLRKMDYDVIPAVIYSLPEIVAVSNPPSAVDGVRIIKVPFAANLRAGIEDHAEGFIKIWLRGNKVAAAQAIGHNASEIMQEVTNMIALGLDIRKVSEIIHAHPTYSEIIRSSLDLALGKAVDFYL